MAAGATGAVRLTATPTTTLVDETVAISVDGLAPNQSTTIRATMRDDAGNPWQAHGVFTANGAGAINVATQAPTAGSYDGVEPMGLFWSMTPVAPKTAERPGFAAALQPITVTLAVEVDGQVCAATEIVRRVVASDVTRIEVRDHGMVGTLFLPPGDGPFPATIIVGGSGGGLNEVSSALTASRGVAAFALAYFGVEPLSLDLLNIPLEYFDTAIDWLQAQPKIKPGGVGFVGTSRGGELALLVGSTFPRIKAVVAYVPSCVVHGGIARGETDLRNPTPAWTFRGSGVTYLPRAEAPSTTPPGAAIPLTPNFLAMWDRATPEQREAATIRAERVNGPILMVSGDDDQMWPSTFFGNQVVDRLKRRGFDFSYEHLAYAGAGHTIGVPGLPSTVLASIHPVRRNLYAFGGTPKATATARADSWPKVIAFLKRSLA